MKLPIKTRDLPGRISTGAYILHAGLETWSVDEAHAQGCLLYTSSVGPGGGPAGS